MKYQKPLSRELSDLSFASGLCSSGTFPNQACVEGDDNVGPCTRGFTAGQTCLQGDAAEVPRFCNPGRTVTQCATGFRAGRD